MPADEEVLYGARNAFLVLIVLLLAIGVYQFVARDGVTWPVAALWVAGAGAFYGSKYYYRWRTSEGAVEGVDSE